MDILNEPIRTKIFVIGRSFENLRMYLYFWINFLHGKTNSLDGMGLEPSAMFSYE